VGERARHHPGGTCAKAWRGTRPRGLARRGLGALALLVALRLGWGPDAPAARAQDGAPAASASDGDRLTGNWGGLRDRLEQRGIEPWLVYTGAMWSNVAGGIRTGTEFDGFVDLGTSLDLAKLGAWKGLGFEASLHWFQGREPSTELVGVDLAQAVSLLEAASTIRAYNLYFTQTIGTSVLLQVGQMAVDSDFMVSRYAGTFLNASFGDLPSQDVNLDAPAYPLAAPGIYLQSELSEHVTSRVGVYTADAGLDVASNHGFGWQLGRNVGCTTFAELALDAAPGGLPGTYTLGGYYANVRKPQLDGTGYAYGQWSGWVMVDQALRLDAMGDPAVGVFARFSYSPDDQVDIAGVYADAGISIYGPIASRPDDVLGLAGSVLRLTHDFLQSEAAAGTVASGGEAVLELTYQIAATPWLVVQPDVQYVLDPLAAGGADATVLGLEVVATF
jgi:porin